MSSNISESSHLSASNDRLMVVMFTDLVDSTALKRKIGPETYRRLKARHDEMVVQALAVAASGRVLQDNGDGYFLSFFSVADGVKMALVFQWLMAREPWPVVFKSRVGLHLGEVAEGQNQVTKQADFTSSAIDLASRTMSLALGGQILMTRSVYEAARQAVHSHPALEGETKPRSLKWTAHGQYLFKGASEPMEVFEVGTEGIAPLQPPADSEKAKRFHQPLLTRRVMLMAAVILLLSGVAVWGLLQRRDPMIEIRRQVIEKQVAEIKSQLPDLRTTNAVMARAVNLVSPPTSAAFYIQSDVRVVDLRGWKPVPSDKVSDFFCGVTMRQELRLKKNAPVDRFERVGRTMGLDLFWNTDEQFPCVIEAQAGNDMVGGMQMKVRKLSIDVSRVKVGASFDLQNTMTYWNSLQTEADQWFGITGYDQAFVVSMLIIFPEGKPVKDYTLSVAPIGKDKSIPFAGPKIVLKGQSKDWLYWEIPEPKKGQVYRINWTW